MIGGWTGYQAAHKLYEARRMFPAFNIPIICMPASINNNLPGSELSIGADTALNNIVQAVDKVKQTAVALRRCYVVEVMGRQCGYLAMMSGLASGAERVFTSRPKPSPVRAAAPTLHHSITSRAQSFHNHAGASRCASLGAVSRVERRSASAGAH